MMKYRFVNKETGERVHARAETVQTAIEKAMCTMDYRYRESERKAPEYWDLELKSVEQI